MFINKKNILIFLPFLCFFAGYIISNIVIGSKTYVTPKLVGLSLYEAVKLTSPHQINIRILSEKEVSNIPAGTILSQKPSPARIIKAHQPVFVTTTKSPPDIISPLLQTLSIEAIEKKCHEMNLKFKSYELEYLAPCNSCIAQLPQANEIVRDKKMIVYCAKDKLNMYIMPDFTLKPLIQVIDFLKEYTDKIEIFNGTQKINFPYNQNAKVVSQKPLAGSLISIKPPLRIQLEVNW